MKDLYSFHATEKDLENYYGKVKEAYLKIFEKVGLRENTYYTFASGGVFSKYSHEFQTLAKNGEDIIFICPKCKLAYNKEIINDITECQGCQTAKSKFQQEKAIEVGNIFKLGSRFSNDFKFKYLDEKNKEKDIIMGCYGIGSSRVMGTIVEIFNDTKGIVWPENIAPYKVHMIVLGDNKKLVKKAEAIYNDLIRSNIEVLYDDRQDSAGIKLNDADLLGIPLRLVISDKTINKNSIEVKKRNSDKIELIKIKEIKKYLL